MAARSNDHWILLFSNHFHITNWTLSLFYICLIFHGMSFSLKFFHFNYVGIRLYNKETLPMLGCQYEYENNKDYFNN